MGNWKPQLAVEMHSLKPNSFSLATHVDLQAQAQKVG